MLKTMHAYTNRRTDEYGGSTENRIKIVEDIYERTVEKVGKNFPILKPVEACGKLGHVTGI